MKSSLLVFDIDERRALAAAALSPLVQALRAELEPLIHARLPIPEHKARLTRIGGRCSFDGTLLDFDPWSPYEHRCPQCHRVFNDLAHHDWWAMGAQLWVAERAAQAAALHLLTDDGAMQSVALRILSELADRYETWPNKDNVLGPTRPFFSTYLESIWLINICHAIALLEHQGNANHDMLERIRRKLIRPSRDLIASYHEGRSNRQVWNEVAILSASRTLGDAEQFNARLNRYDGLFDLFEHGLLDDGTWYEGENYHLFAHRGLWYGVQLLRAAKVPLPAASESRYRAGFVTPFLGILPDDTIPSRRDSQYKVSIRQWRFAEWCEMGIAHAASHNAHADERLAGTLHRLYHPDSSAALKAQYRHPFSTADAERNEPAGALSRADLSWRALLMITPALAEGERWSPGSICLPNQGLAVIRRDSGRRYIALEGGHTGGGHGHPDRLALTVQHNHDRWLEDPGTGSYVEQKLHWYRSTLAHAAPLVDGSSQDSVPARLLAFEDRGGAGWMSKRVDDVKPGVHLQRTIVVCDGYLIDVLEWEADRVVQIDLPMPRSFEFRDIADWSPADPHGAGGLEDGFDFLTDVMTDARALHDTAPPEFSNSAITVARDSQDNSLDVVHYAANTKLVAWRAEAPGPPGQQRELRRWLRFSGEKGCLIGVWSWVPLDRYSISANADGFASVAVTVTGTESVHTRTALGWHIALKARNATSSIDLSWRTEPDDAASSANDASGFDEAESCEREPHAPHVVYQLHEHPRTVAFDLSEPHYRRTEQTWAEAGRPEAAVAMSVKDDLFTVTVVRFTDTIVVPGEDQENLLDNERRDVNADGAEVFITTRPGAPWVGSWLAVPATEGPATESPATEGPATEGPATKASPTDHRARSVETTPGSPPAKVRWAPVTVDNRKAFMLEFHLPVAEIPVEADGTFALEVIVNERPRDRVRRRGQLVMSGGGGFAYLRGDRADSDDALTFRLPVPLASHAN